MISERVGFRASIGYKVRNVVSNQIFESQRGRWWDTTNTTNADTNSTTHTDTTNDTITPNQSQSERPWDYFL